MALKSIDELMGRSFVIPSYQRGYRWGRLEVTAMLNDLWEFRMEEPSRAQFYCLQPIVLYHNSTTNQLELLDGQQRLTTLYILLSYLDDKRKEDGYTKLLFTLRYATRAGSETFLQTKGFTRLDEEAMRNIDYYHMAQAYGAITDWFEKAPAHPGAKGKLIPVLLDASGQGPNVRVIEYEVTDDSNPIDVFLRLNQGKIPLTDAELVKALLLQEDKYDENELKRVRPTLDLISTEWYDVELGLADPERWAFVAPSKYSSSTHIDLILKYVAEDLQAEMPEKGHECFEGHPHFCYAVFTEWIARSQVERKDCVKALWERVMSTYQYVDEWYSDLTLYHYIGYLCSVGNMELRELLMKAKEKSNSAFRVWLRQRIGEKLPKDIKELRYLDDEGSSKDQPKIRQILLLHSIFLCLQHPTERVRFPFSKYRASGIKWSLEHICPQNPEKFTTPAEALAWLDDHINLYAQTGKAEGQLQAMRQLQKDLENASDAAEEVIARINESVDKMVEEEGGLLGQVSPHSLGNLCLLTKEANSSLSNDFFAVKRRKIIQGKLALGYIPPATRMVFLKAFSSYATTNYLWQESDANDYLASLCAACSHFQPNEK